MTVDQGRPLPAPPEQDEETQPKATPPPNTGGPMGRWGAAGMPLERASDFGSAIRRLWERLRPERFRLIAVIVFSITGVTLSVLGPRLLGRATDQLIGGLLPGAGGIDFPALHRILLGVIALYLCSASFQYLQSFILAGMVQRTMYRLRSDVEDKLNRLPLSYVDRAARGDLLSRVTNDIDNLAQSLQQTISQLMMSVFMLLGTSIMMLLISPILAIIALVTLPLSTFIIRFIAKRSRGRFIAQWGHTGKLNALVEESLTGHAIVKTFGRQRDVEEVFRETNDDLYEASFGAQFISGTIQPAMIFLGNLNFVAIAVIGGVRVASNAMTIGGIQAFIQYSRQFSQPMQQLASMANLFQSGLASAERVFHLLDADEQSTDPAKWYPIGNGAASNGYAYRPKNSKRWTARWEVAENGRRRRRTKSGFRTKKEATEFAASQAAPLRGRVEFDHVSFSYDPDRPLITDLSLVAEPGRTVAIVGPTGAGKTTLVNLIMRFYELDGGKITLDGEDIAKMPRASLRSNIGMVLQDTWMFEGTIRDNIAYGNPDATEEQILAAARATFVDRFVHALPDGYDTIVDDESGAISTGEKQLLTIARAFLSDPTILILDEATSSVDTRTEVLLQEAMAAIRTQRTSFVIAHRLSTIRNADVILVMEDGNIVEQGHHSDLLAQGGAYARLYNAQFAAPVVEDAEV
ncbi:MAG: ABC transporter transmembrane domain-containing protein [Actinomycetota bacterium]